MQLSEEPLPPPSKPVAAYEWFDVFVVQFKPVIFLLSINKAEIQNSEMSTVFKILIINVIYYIKRPLSKMFLIKGMLRTFYLSIHSALSDSVSSSDGASFLDKVMCWT